jgi:polysaccharide biosynthesis/export protein
MPKTLMPLMLLAALLSLPAAAQEEEAPPRQDYRINAGDTLEISVWKEPDLQREVLVRPDGAISFPLAGELPAEGARSPRSARSWSAG